MPNAPLPAGLPIAADYARLTSIWAAKASRCPFTPLIGLRQRNSTTKARRLFSRAGKGPTTALASAIILGMELHAHVKLSGDRDGEYLITEERPDGSLTLVPDTSFEAIRKRLGTEPATLAEFEAEHGPVQPPDGEG